MSVGRRKDWALAAVVCAAMLVLPALSWLLIPRPTVFVLPSAPSAGAIAPGDGVSAPTRPRIPNARGLSSSHWGANGDEAAPRTTARVEGIVLDPEGHRAEGATVTCEDHDPPIAGATDADGRFDLPADADGCRATARHDQFFPSEAVTLAGGPGNTLRLTRGGAIEGVVVDDAGGGVASYMLSVESYRGPAVDRAPVRQMKTITDGRGAFLWDNLPAGRYILTASADGRPPTRSSSIEVEAARTTSHVRIALVHGATVTGRVIDASTRKPIAGATIALDAMTTTGAQGVAPVKSDEQGGYTLEGAPPGRFSLRVTHAGHRTRTLTGLTTQGAALHQDIELNPVVDGGTGEDFAGIGAFLEASPTGVRFGRLVPSGPAEAAGLAAGDVIRRIDGADASALAVVDCMQNLRGPDGSRVTVQVDRAGKLVEVTIQRRAMSL